ncbi:unnamed protein product [Rotaria sordida]|uniref:Uncharacterized protein n=1 Tax=Rotaria sordida TaxID=392033 RepID=A0A813R2Z5_9BILA|nr:unnamed protein product [Rotaria sordida]CAF0760674.1 unnamed protein product [Rotaria sordida]CAF0776235.1 unnamed protein product [Rotaria sordida]
MSHYYSSTIIIVFVTSLTFVLSLSSSSIKDKIVSKKNGTSLNLHNRISSQGGKLRNISTAIHDRFKPSHEWNENNNNNNDKIEKSDDEYSSTNEQIANVVVLTSLSGIYVWWPTLFGGDDSFHLLLSQEDVPRFHDVTGDEYGHIYLTAPHERTVYRLQYSDGWWISNFSNHSLMNSIRSEMPLFLNIHRVSSILYVYGHSDIQVIDLLERPRTRGSAPFMKRLRELSPNLRISDLIIDQLTSDGYIIGDSYGWCIVIRCSLSVNDCIFLFKIPSSYDSRPYPCSATIDFSNKMMYLSLEEKILAVHLNEQTNFDRRFVLTEKSGPRSTLGYDDIVIYNNTILYTDVLRPILHICPLKNSDRCLNLSLIFPSPQRTILPLRLSIVNVRNLRPPIFDDEDEIELHINQSDTHSSPLSLRTQNTTTTYQYQIVDITTIQSHEIRQTSLNSIWMLILGIFIGLLLGGLSFMIYYIIWNKNRPKLKKPISSTNVPSSSTKISIPERKQSLLDERKRRSESGSKSSSDSAKNRLLETTTNSSTSGSSEWTTITTSSLSYQPDIVL